MPLSPRSIATLDFAERLRQRALGNGNDQRICYGSPNRNYEYGILFSETDALNSRRGDRTDIRPNALSLRFRIEGVTQTIQLKITPSFWLYFRQHVGADFPEDIGDFWRSDIVWVPWDQRDPPIGNENSKVSPEDENLAPYVRARYSQSFDISVPLDNHGGLTRNFDSDLDAFRSNRAILGAAPVWGGEIRVWVEPVENEIVEVRVSLVNTYTFQGRRYGEPAWFDVRMRVRHQYMIQPVFCPLLEHHVNAQTVNCVLVEDGQLANDTLEVEQVNLAVRQRQDKRPAVSFEDANWSRVASIVQNYAREAEAEHAQWLRLAVSTVNRDDFAVRAMEIVFETFRRAMRVRAQGESWYWYRHQLSILVLGAREYLTGANTLNPLVLNVPTAGGKTEAFSSLALWTIAYEALISDPHWGTAIIKYPTKLLSSDQAGRLAHYVMHFDTILADETNGREKPRGLGLFFGADTDTTDRLEVIGQECPECGQQWKVQQTRIVGPRQVGCPNGHVLLVALQDEIFPRPPTLIVGTIDKFVSKSRKTEMGHILGGGPFYWCPEQQWYVRFDHCRDSQDGSVDHQHRRIERSARLTALILDEAHLLREEIGTLDSHFETYYLETARELGGRYPVTVVSTATIAQAEEHCRQLGLEQPILFPSKRRENHPVYYDENPDEIQHVVLSFMPRGRAIAWALPMLFKRYLEVFDFVEKQVESNCEHLRPALIYCGSYPTRDQTLFSIRRHVDPTRPRGTEIGEFSRRRFAKVGIRTELENLRKKDAVVSTNIASVGVDFGELNLIFYFGMPYNVNEFIQSMNRTGRRLPALVCIVHNPYLERDAAFYAYMRPFLARPEELVEAVPLNRYARKAVEHTFSAVALGQLQHLWYPRILPTGADIRRARQSYGRRGFREARGNELNENIVESLLQRTYRSAGDPSGEYPRKVSEEWQGMVTNIVNYAPQGRGKPEFPYGDNWIWYVDGIPDPMYQLRIPDPVGYLEYTPEAKQLAEANIRTIYGNDRDEISDIREEEADILDGALRDLPPEKDNTDV